MVVGHWAGGRLGGSVFNCSQNRLGAFTPPFGARDSICSAFGASEDEISGESVWKMTGTDFGVCARHG